MKTFEQICPQWASQIKKAGSFENTSLRPQVNLDLDVYTSCIVGEAHGFTSSYNCDICFAFSVEFVDCRSDRQFAKTKREFVKHFNEAHVEK